VTLAPTTWLEEPALGPSPSRHDPTHVRERLAAMHCDTAAHLSRPSPGTPVRLAGQSIGTQRPSTSSGVASPRSPRRRLIPGSYSRYHPVVVAQVDSTTMNRRLSTGPAEAAFLTEPERRQLFVCSQRKHGHLFDHLAGQTLHEVLLRLTAKGWLLPVERGSYVVVPRAAHRTWREHPFVIAAGLAPDSFYRSYGSLTEAASQAIKDLARVQSRRTAGRARARGPVDD